MSVGDYQELKKLGSGGFGAVWLVRCNQDKRQYALKKIDTSNLTKDYTREATTLCQINHSNVLAYKTHFKHGNTFYIVMEYCPRGNLKEKIQQRCQRFTENEIVSWTVQICHALQHIHEQNIIHRDLKPDNIFLTDNDVVKIGDFGLARELQPGEWAMSPYGNALYMSPEITGGRSHNSKTDIYSFGCCIYELMTLRPYVDFDEWCRTGKRIYGDMPSSGYSATFVSLVQRMVSVNPAERPDASEILQSPVVRNYANTHYVSFNVCISSKRKLFVVQKNSSVKDLYSSVAMYAGEEESNFTLMLNGHALDVTKSLSDYSFANDQQSGILGQNLTNLVFVRRQIGGLTSL